jgi:hypothetical protein
MKDELLKSIDIDVKRIHYCDKIDFKPIDFAIDNELNCIMRDYWH